MADQTAPTTIKISKAKAEKDILAEFKKHTKTEAITCVEAYDDEFLCFTTELAALRLFHVYRENPKPTRVFKSSWSGGWCFALPHDLGDMLDLTTS